MEIPKYDAMYYALLKALSDREVHTNREIADYIAKEMSVSPDSRQRQTLSSGKSVFSDRVSWACTYLKKAGLIESVRRGHHCITAEGLRVFEDPPETLNNVFLCKYPSFKLFYQGSSPAAKTSANLPETDQTPDDLLDQAIASINQKLADELLTEIMAKDAAFFENLVVTLLLKMGYGGSATDSGFVTQKSNDGGIDGIIREDKLGFDQIYIQAKRWAPDNSISRPELQKFSGALRDVGAAKGLFITTAKFSDGARASAEKQHIVLADGARLTKLMIEYNVGVSTVSTYEVKSIDTDLFNNDPN